MMLERKKKGTLIEPVFFKEHFLEKDILTWSTELAALGGNLGDSALLHLGVFTDGTAPVLGVIEARSSPGGEGVFVVGNSLAALAFQICINIST